MRSDLLWFAIETKPKSMLHGLRMIFLVKITFLMACLMTYMTTIVLKRLQRNSNDELQKKYDIEKDVRKKYAVNLYLKY